MNRAHDDGRYERAMNWDAAVLDSPGVQEHLRATICTWLGLPRAEQQKAPVLPADLRSLLLRQEEFAIHHRDQWGCWEHGASDNYQRGKLWTAEIDEWVAAQRTALSRKGVRLSPLWPAERGFAFVMTHDVDVLGARESGIQMLRRARQSFAGLFGHGGLESALRTARWLYGAARPSSFGPSDLAETLGYCVDIETNLQVNTSYFFTLYPVSRFAPFDCVYSPNDRCRFEDKLMTAADVMRSIGERGFDIGLHGSYYSALEDGLLADQRARLEMASGRAVTTTRQHWLHYDLAITPRLQEEAGFLADSTLGFNRNIGYRAGTSLPHFTYDLSADVARKVLQIPLVVQEGPLFAPDALELDIDLAKSLFRRLIEQTKRVQGVLTAVFHPHRMTDPDIRDLFKWSLEYALENNGWCLSVRDLHDHWKNRLADLGFGG